MHIDEYIKYPVKLKRDDIAVIVNIQILMPGYFFNSNWKTPLFIIAVYNLDLNQSVNDCYY